VPEYSEGDYIVHICKTYAVACYSCERANASHSMSRRVAGVHFPTDDVKLWIYMTSWVILTQHKVL